MAVLVKKGFMMNMWRIQQSSAIINLTVWSLTLTAVLYKDYLQVHFVRHGIVNDDQFFEGMLMLFVVLFGGIIFSGYVYDRILQLWREQAVVMMERNPFQHERQNPKEIINWETTHIPMLRVHGLQLEADFNTKWNYRTMRIDPFVRDRVLHVIRLVRDSPLPEPDDQFVRAIILEKKGEWPDGRSIRTPKGFHRCTSCEIFVAAPRSNGGFQCPECQSKQVFKGKVTKKKEDD